MMNRYDLTAVAVYFGFMIAVGVAFRAASRNSSDYFRGGGAMTWWMTGASAFMATFSAWTFVGCAGEIYANGSLVISLFLFNAVANLGIAAFLAHKLRRMRAVTPVDAVRERFGFASEQFYAWVSMLLQFLIGGIGLYTASVFLSPLLGFSVSTGLVVIGVAVTFMSVTGGAWAVVASDFVQMMIILVVTTVAAVYLMFGFEVGGPAAMAAKLPEEFFVWTHLRDHRVLEVWLVGIFLNQVMTACNLSTGAARFLYVKSDTDARKAALLVAVGYVVGPMIWFIPPAAATFLEPDLAETFSFLKNPQEAAYIAACLDRLPAGMLGLLACGIFAATMSSLDSALNRNSGIVVRNIYLPLLRPGAGEGELLNVGRVMTVVFGVALVVVGLLFSSYSNLPVFEWTLLIAGLLSIPIIVPMTLGLFVQRTPGWSAWSTTLVGFCTAAAIQYGVDLAWLAEAIGVPAPASEKELGELKFGTAVIVISVVATVWFLCTTLFFRGVGEEEAARVAGFFRKMRTPVLGAGPEVAIAEAMQYRILSRLCLAYGAFLLLGVLIPNDAAARGTWLLTALIIGGMGGLLHVGGKRRAASAAAAGPEDVAAAEFAD